MKYKLATILVVATAVVFSTLASFSVVGPAKAAPPNDPDTPGTPWPIDDPRYRPNDATDNVILKWNEELLQAIRLHPPTTGPTITARAIGVLHTATYDAWAAYDSGCQGHPSGQPAATPGRRAHSGQNKNKAISFAAYKVLTDLFPASRYPRIGEVDFPGQMAELGYTPNNSTDRTKPDGIGNVAAQAVLDYRHNDNSNQLNGYADTTGTVAPGRSTPGTRSTTPGAISHCVSSPPPASPPRRRTCPRPAKTASRPTTPSRGRTPRSSRTC